MPKIHIDIPEETFNRLKKRQQEYEPLYAVINRLLDATEPCPVFRKEGAK